MPKSHINELVETLAAQPRFAGCSAHDLALLAKSANAATVPAAWPIIHESTPADACYVILDGEIEVRVQHNPVARLGVGSVVGEVGLFTRRLRNATVVSVTPITVLHVAAEAFHKLISSTPSIRAALCGPSMAV